MDRIEPLQTDYNHIKFRSRTEARWALFFDLCGIKYIYEYEGYELDSGYYLPDFYLPDLDCFFEVKPDLSSIVKNDKLELLKKARSLQEFTRAPVYVAFGVPEPRANIIMVYKNFCHGWEDLPESDCGCLGCSSSFGFITQNRRLDEIFDFAFCSYGEGIDDCLGHSRFGRVKFKYDSEKANDRFPIITDDLEKNYSIVRGYRFYN